MARKSTTRREQGSGTIRQRPDGRWEGRYSLERDPGTGKQVQKSIYGKTQSEVAAKLRKITSSIDSGIFVAPEKMTVKKWMEEWLEVYCKGRLKPYTISGYEVVIKNHIEPNMGAKNLQAVRGIHVQSFYKKLLESGKSPKTIKNIASVLHKAFDTAQKQGLISANPCDSADIPSCPKKEVTPLTDAEIPAFLNAIDGDPMKNAFALCMFAGLREGECLGLSWDQVNFDDHTITINQQLQREKNKGGQYVIREFTKNNKPRVIQPPAIAFEYLKNEKAKQARAKLAAGSLWDNPDNLVFTNEFGRHYAIFTFYKHFKKIAAEIGRPDARPHDLRHTAATIAVASGADIKSVQAFMGHATASFTLNVYTHASNQMKKDTAARMDAYFEGLSKL